MFVISPFQTATRYESLYNRVRNGEYSRFHGYAYDGVWVIARALDAIIKQNGGWYSLSDFRNERLYNMLNDTDFRGVTVRNDYPDSKVHGASMGPIWGRQDPDGPRVDPMIFAIWVLI